MTLSHATMPDIADVAIMIELLDAIGLAEGQEDDVVDPDGSARRLRESAQQEAVAPARRAAMIALAGALSFILVGWSQPQLPDGAVGFVYLPALVGIALTSMFFARFGARLAHRLSPRLLKRLFALLLLAVGISFLV